jgi:hypothetical protein
MWYCRRLGNRAFRKFTVMHTDLKLVSPVLCTIDDEEKIQLVVQCMLEGAVYFIDPIIDYGSNLFISLLLHYTFVPYSWWRRDNAVCIETSYGLDDRGFGVRIPVRYRIFSSPRLPERLWAHPASNAMGSGGFFHGGRAAGVQS